MKYNGYLAPYVRLIQRLAKEGVPTKKIATHLYDDLGVRAPWGSHWKRRDTDIDSMCGMVNYVKRGGPFKKTSPVTTVVLPWQTWTPEMQEAEFQAGYHQETTNQRERNTAGFKVGPLEWRQANDNSPQFPLLPLSTD